MPLPTVTSRPEKTIDSIVSRWNAANLPLIYDITNTKWPANSEDSTIAITSITDDNGFAKINRGSNDGEVAKEWILIDGTTNYDGPQQITAVDGNNLTIDAPFVDNDTGTTLIYFQNYTTLIRVNVGLDPTHEHAADKPNTLVGTIEQRPDTNNITLSDVREYVKNKLNTNYDESQSGWPNDLNSWTDFYISFAERYDLVTANVVGDFTSAFTDDTEGGDIIFLKAVHGALQFGDARGGNMFDFVVFDDTGAYFDGDAKYMTFFERPKIIDCNNFNLSIILDQNAEYPDLNIIRLKITEFDSNDNELLTTITEISRQDYGLYRLDLDGLLFQDDVNYINFVLLDSGSFELSETKRIDVDIECGCIAGTIETINNWLIEDSGEWLIEDTGEWLLEG